MPLDSFGICEHCGVEAKRWQDGHCRKWKELAAQGWTREIVAGNFIAICGQCNAAKERAAHAEP